MKKAYKDYIDEIASITIKDICRELKIAPNNYFTEKMSLEKMETIYNEVNRRIEKAKSEFEKKLSQEKKTSTIKR